MNRFPENKIIEELRNGISSSKNSHISLSSLHKAAERLNPEMPVYLMSPEGKTLFFRCISMLISNGLISPVGRKPGSADGFYLKYKICKRARQKDDELIEQIIRSIVPPARLDFYLKNPEHYLDDKEIIEKVMGFLKAKNTKNTKNTKNAENDNWVTVNERSYELFGDEKFLRGAESDRSRGKIILNRLGLDYRDIGCRETLEPFFSFIEKTFHSTTDRQIFIIENRDTFWSFKRNMTSIKADMLVYGEGRKILSSFQFMEEYNVTLGRDKIYYFGDLDAEGVNIFCELADKYPSYGIMPFREGYLAMLEIGTRRGLSKTPKPQRMSRVNIERFLSFFERPRAAQLKSLLEKGFYIPQEALSATEMKERFGNA